MQCLHLETPSFHKSSQYLLIVISGSTKNKLQMASFHQFIEYFMTKGHSVMYFWDDLIELTNSVNISLDVQSMKLLT